MLEPKEILLNGKTYVLHKMETKPGLDAYLRFTHIESRDEREELIALLMKWVTVKLENGTETALSSDALINNHVPDVQTLLKLEEEMLAYNFDFFGRGEISSSLEWTEKVARTQNTEMLTDLLLALSKVGERASTN